MDGEYNFLKSKYSDYYEYTNRPFRIVSKLIIITNNYLTTHRGVYGGCKWRAGIAVRGRALLGWTDAVKMTLCSRGMTVEAARKIGRSGEPWSIGAYVDDRV